MALSPPKPLLWLLLRPLLAALPRESRADPQEHSFEKEVTRTVGLRYLLSLAVCYEWLLSHSLESEGE